GAILVRHIAHPGKPATAATSGSTAPAAPPAFRARRLHSRPSLHALARHTLPGARHHRASGSKSTASARSPGRTRATWSREPSAAGATRPALATRPATLHHREHGHSARRRRLLRILLGLGHDPVDIGRLQPEGAQ